MIDTPGTCYSRTGYDHAVTTSNHGLLWSSLRKRLLFHVTGPSLVSPHDELNEATFVLPREKTCCSIFRSIPTPRANFRDIQRTMYQGRDTVTTRHFQPGFCDRSSVIFTLDCGARDLATTVKGLPLGWVVTGDLVVCNPGLVLHAALRMHTPSHFSHWSPTRL